MINNGVYELTKAIESTSASLGQGWSVGAHSARTTDMNLIKKYWFFVLEIALLVAFPWLWPWALAIAVIGLVLCLRKERGKGP